MLQVKFGEYVGAADNDSSPARERENAREADEERNGAQGPRARRRHGCQELATPRSPGSSRHNDRALLDATFNVGKACSSHRNRQAIPSLAASGPRATFAAEEAQAYRFRATLNEHRTEACAAVSGWHDMPVARSRKMELALRAGRFNAAHMLTFARTRNLMRLTTRAPARFCCATHAHRPGFVTALPRVFVVERECP
ncbi:MAG: hypothetical protein JWQ73_681 [Variovorax sp.]|nr:hypothetical protein [Variovorax sp.]